jgi:hypothetical protein
VPRLARSTTGKNRRLPSVDRREPGDRLCAARLLLAIWKTEGPLQERAFGHARRFGFMPVGAGIIVPVILAYTGWAYWVFCGKVGAEGYQ